MYPYGNYDKKSLNMLILEILKKYTDDDHRLRQEEIIHLLEQNYGVKCDRRSIKSNVLSLQQLGYDIPLKHGYCLLNRRLEADDLRQIIDCVLFSTSLSRSRAMRLVKRLIELGNRYFKPQVRCIYGLPEAQIADAKEIRKKLDVLNDAVDISSKVSFVYNEYGTDFRLHPVSGTLVVNPYQIIATDGRYYLLGNDDAGDEARYYRVDQMTEVESVREKAKPRNLVPLLERGYRMPQHRAEQRAMDMGDRAEIRLRTSPAMMGTLMDSFGKDFEVEEEDGGTILVKVACAENAMFRWAMQCGAEVEILEPEGLRAALREAAERMLLAYKKPIAGKENESAGKM